MRIFGAPSRFFNIAPTVSLPIFDGGRLRADLDARDADYDLAVAQYNEEPGACTGRGQRQHSTSCMHWASRLQPSNVPPTSPSSPTTP